MHVFLTDGNQRATLAAVRALGESPAVRVTVGEGSSPSLAGSSKYCTEQVAYPSPVHDPGGFVEWFRAGGVAPDTIVIPVTDVTMQLLSGWLATRSNSTVPPPRSVMTLQDKRETLELAREGGLSFPPTFMLHDEDDIEEVAAKVSYPAVLKPRFSRYRKGNGWSFGTVEYARTPEDLVARYRRMHLHIPFPLVQELTEGTGGGIFLLVWDGELKAAFSHRRLRELPATGGMSVYCESVALDHELVRRCLSVLRRLDWRGVAMFEFKHDSRDNRPRLMEVNGRFWGSLHLATYAGVNFPLMLSRLASGESVPSQLTFRTGVRNRWFVGDSRRLWDLVRAHGFSSASASGLRDFLRYDRDCRSEDVRPGDLKPFLYACRRAVSRVWRAPVKRVVGEPSYSPREAWPPSS